TSTGTSAPDRIPVVVVVVAAVAVPGATAVATTPRAAVVVAPAAATPVRVAAPPIHAGVPVATGSAAPAAVDRQLPPGPPPVAGPVRQDAQGPSGRFTMRQHSRHPRHPSSPRSLRHSIASVIQCRRVASPSPGWSLSPQA